MTAADTLDETGDPGERKGVEMLIVGLGASAGGIRALKEFFAAVPQGAGMAYVVILHLSPDHESNLAQVLQTAARIPVVPVHSRTRIEPDHAYVVSQNQKLSLSGDYIEVSEMIGVLERRAPIDAFFRTLADAWQTHAASIILSGTGANGSMGMKRVKERGGLCLAQDPAEADFADMPRNAIATGFVDCILPVGAMPERLTAYRGHRGEALHRAIDPDDTNRALVDVFAQLRLRTGHDFANYKRSTVMRRIERRMSLHELGSLREYAEFLKESRDEPNALLKDLLISVTGFFRDVDAYLALEQKVIPRLFANKGADDSVRVWCAGCATGEEAYSIAMLLREYAPDPISGPSIQVFATDIDDHALAKARSGLYTLNDAADLAPDRLQRFFIPDANAYLVRRELREIVLFAAHNVIKDPPFSHLDLITCRNVLIYLDRPAQERVLRLFHFGLNPGGYLFLGNSESPDEASSLFVSLDKEQRIYQSRSVATPLTFPAVAATPLLARTARENAVPYGRPGERLLYQELHQGLLEQYAPPSLVVNQDYEIVHLTERAGRYLQFVGGEPSQSLLKVVRPELRLELHSALFHATETRTRTEVYAGPVPIEGKEERVKITVSPVFGEEETSRGMILIVFDTVAVGGKNDVKTAIEGTTAMAPIARQLEEELGRVKLQLRNTIEQHELQQEESKASNEELQAMNEELRASSEELETSKEELQSLNEELRTVNQELKVKIDELSQANNDTRNLMNSTDLATVFVDRAMRIKLFTPRARSIFNLMPSDAGRPLHHITHRLHYPEMVHDIESVLETLAVVEREIISLERDWYIARVLPYRTADDRIAGAVLTFTNITDGKRAELARQESEERVRVVLESIPEFAIVMLDAEGLITRWNTAAQDVFGYGEREVIGQHVRLLFTAADRAAGVPEEEMRIAREAGRSIDERWHARSDGSTSFVSGVMAPLKGNDKVVGYIRIARNLTERKAMEEGLRADRDQIESRFIERTRELAESNVSLRSEIEKKIESEELRVRLLRQIVNVQEDERRRISRELHDQLGQELTALALKLAVLKRTSELSVETRAQLEAIEAIVKELDNDVEFLVWELRPTGLDDLGLSDALSDYVERWSRNVDLPVQMEAALESRLPPEVETALYRIAQEALNNVAKHAQASSVAVTLKRNDADVLLEIADDGIGFDPHKPRDGTALGLSSMRERAALVGGSLSIDSAPGHGTRVRAGVPAGGGGPSPA